MRFSLTTKRCFERPRTARPNSTRRATVLIAAGALALGVAGGDGLAGGRHGIALTQGRGYCVSVSDDGSFRGKVLVPFHKPDPKRLEALRQSVSNAVHLIGTQETDARHQGNILAGAGHVLFDGEGAPRVEGCVTRCVCSSKLPDQDRDIGAPVCGGACRDCWDCRIDCSGLPGRAAPGTPQPPGGGAPVDDAPASGGG